MPDSIISVIGQNVFDEQAKVIAGFVEIMGYIDKLNEQVRAINVNISGAESLNDISKAAQTAAPIFEKLTAVVENFNKVQSATNDISEQYAPIAKENIEKQIELRTQMSRNTSVINQNKQSIANNNEIMVSFGKTAGANSAIIKTLTDSNADLTASNEKLTISQKMLSVEAMQLNPIINASIKGYKAVTESIIELEARQNILIKQYKALEAAEREGLRGNGMRNDILALDAQLKALDASIGRNQRKVGSYELFGGASVGELAAIRKEMEVLQVSEQGASEKMEVLKARAVELTIANHEVAASIKEVVAAQTGIVSKASAYNFNPTNTLNKAAMLENATSVAAVKKQMIELQAAGMGDTEAYKLLESEAVRLTKVNSVLSASIKQQAAAIQTVNEKTVVAAEKTGRWESMLQRMGIRFILNLVIFQVLIEAIQAIGEAWTRASDRMNVAQVTMGEAAQKSGGQFSEEAVNIEIMGKRLKDATTTMEEKQDIVRQLSDVLGEQGVAINSINDAEKWYKDQSNDFISALNDRAEAAGNYQVMMENAVKKARMLADPNSELGTWDYIKPGGVISNTINKTSPFNILNIKETYKNAKDEEGKKQATQSLMANYESSDIAAKRIEELKNSAAAKDKKNGFTTDKITGKKDFGDDDILKQQQRELKVLESQKESGKELKKDKKEQLALEDGIYAKQQQILDTQLKLNEAHKKFLSPYDVKGLKDIKNSSLDLEAQKEENTNKYNVRKKQINDAGSSRAPDYTKSDLKDAQEQTKEIAAEKAKRMQIEAELELMTSEKQSNTLAERLEAYRKYQNLELEAKKINLKAEQDEIQIALNKIAELEKSKKPLTPEQHRLVGTKTGLEEKSSTITATIAFDEIKTVDTNQKGITEIYQKEIDKRIAALKLLATNNKAIEDKLLDDLLIKFNKGHMSADKYDKQKKIIQDHAQATTRSQQLAQAKSDLNDPLLINNPAGNDKLKETVDTVTNETNEAARKEAEDKLRIHLAKVKAEKMAGAESAIELAKSTVETIEKIEQNGFEQKMMNLDAEQRAIQLNATQQIQSVNATVGFSIQKQQQLNAINAQSAAQENEIAQQRKEIARQAYESQKTASIAGVIMNAAQGELKAYAEEDPIIGTIFAALIAATAIEQIAAINSAPVPQFFKGTDYAPGGRAIVGEKGSELMIDPSGKLSLTPDMPTIMDVSRGTKIITADRTKNLLEQAKNASLYGATINPQTTDYSTSLNKMALSFEHGFGQVVKAVNNIKQPIIIIQDRSAHNEWFNKSTQTVIRR